MFFQFSHAFFVGSYALLQALLSTIISIIGALTLAYFFNTFNFFGKRYINALVPLLCIMPSKLTALGISSLSCTGFWGIIWAHCTLNIPLAFLVINAAYQTMNPQWQLVAQEYGASVWQAYKDIEFPFLKPTILSAALIIFLLCFTSFSIPQILGRADHHLTLDILMQQSYGDNNMLATFLYAIPRFLVVLPLCFLRSKQQSLGWLEHGVLERKVVHYSMRKHGPWWAIIIASISMLVGMPLVLVAWNSFDMQVLRFWHTVALGASDPVLGLPVYQIVVNSLALALVSGIASTMLGFLLCRMMVSVHSRLLRKILACFSTAIFIAGSVGCGIFFAWISHTTVCSKFVIASLCHTILNYPFAFRIINAQWGSWQAEWHLSAQSFGATLTDRMFTLEWPFLKRALMHALCLSFGLSLTEVGAGSVLDGETGTTIPMAIRIYRNAQMHHAALGLSVILLCIVLIVTLVLGFKKKELMKTEMD